MMVAALDFGTTYSGYAFSFRNDFETDPLKIQANPVWMTGSSQFMSLKTPTCLLLDQDQQFVAFGFQAENMYAECVLDDVQDDFYYFHRFKMYLHSNKVFKFNFGRSRVIDTIRLDTQNRVSEYIVSPIK